MLETSNQIKSLSSTSIFQTVYIYSKIYHVSATQNAKEGNPNLYRMMAGYLPSIDYFGKFLRRVKSQYRANAATYSSGIFTLDQKMKKQVKVR